MTSGRSHAVRLALALGGLGIVLNTPTAAWAHATLNRATPPVQSSLAAAPVRVSLEFSQAVTLVPGSL